MSNFIQANWLNSNLFSRLHRPDGGRGQVPVTSEQLFTSLFTNHQERQLHLWIGGRQYAAFGNLFLLKYPIKEQVFFHRKNKNTGQPTELTEGYRQERARLLRIAEEGSVLVTPGISKGESLVVNDALDARLPLILLQKEPIGEYWKPPQRRFYACAAGHYICEATEMRILNYSNLKFSSDN